jgi:hypothetical protein
MAGAAERMQSMRKRRKATGLRVVRLTIPDARSAAIRRRVATQVANLNAAAERKAMAWIEAVSEFDADTAR